MGELVVTYKRDGVDFQHVITPTEDGQVCLTDIYHRLGMGDEKKKPTQFLRRKRTRELVSKLKGVKTHLSTKGVGGTTWAGVQIALAYLQWLSTDFQIQANNIVIERLQEEADPELAAKRGIERAVEGFKKQGKDDQWINRRINGVVKRREFTAVLKDHGVYTGIHYAQCTDAINYPVLGGRAKDVKKQLAIPDNAKLRDHLDSLQLTALQFAEELAAAKMRQKEQYGASACQETCSQAGWATKRAMSDMEKN